MKNDMWDKIKKAVAPDLELYETKSERHKSLLEAKREADEALIKKWEAEKKAREQQNAEPKKTSCAPGSGATGMLNNLACREQQSGVGH